MKKTAYTHIIWDFNGTISNDVDACIKSANHLLSVHGLPTVKSIEQYRSLFGFPIQDYYARMGFDFEKTPYAELAPEWMDYYFTYSKNAIVYPDIPKALDALREKGMEQWILSATEVNMLRGQLEGLGILSRFDGILGWLEYNMRRAAGLLGNDEADREEGRKQVESTVAEIKRQKAQMVELRRWLYEHR